MQVKNLAIAIAFLSAAFAANAQGAAAAAAAGAPAPAASAPVVSATVATKPAPAPVSASSNDDSTSSNANVNCAQEDGSTKPAIAKAIGKNSVAIAKCGVEPKSIAKSAIKPAAPKDVVAKDDPLPGRLLTVARDGTIHSAPIPTKETRVIMVDGPAIPVIQPVHAAPLIIDDRRTQAPTSVVIAPSAPVYVGPAPVVIESDKHHVQVPTGKPGDRTVSYLNAVTGKSYTATVKSDEEETTWLAQMVEQCTADKKAEVRQVLAGSRGANMPEAQKQAILATAKCLDTRVVAKK